MIKPLIGGAWELRPTSCCLEGYVRGGGSHIYGMVLFNLGNDFITHALFWIWQRPFRGNSNDSISKAIAFEELKYPDNVHELLTPHCIDAISKVSTFTSFGQDCVCDPQIHWCHLILLHTSYTNTMVQLMSKDPHNRLGVGEDGFSQLITHPWFNDLDWQQLEQKAVIPPFCPDVRQQITLLL